jgi:hypothetical protein
VIDLFWNNSGVRLQNDDKNFLYFTKGHQLRSIKVPSFLVKPSLKTYTSHKLDRNYQKCIIFYKFQYIIK